MSKHTVASTFNQQLFALLAAPPDLHGAPLLAAVALGRWAVFAGPALLTLLWLGGDLADRRSAVAASLTGAIALAIAAGLSFLVVTPRPFMDGPARNFLDHVRDGGFPSDHATLLFALALTLWLRQPPKLPHSWVAFLALALSVSWARVFLGAHYPFDIAGAAGVAALATVVMASSPGRIAVARIAVLTEKMRGRLAGFRRIAPR